MIQVDFPDKSTLYLSAELTKEDQNFVCREFWEQRWERWGAEALPYFMWAVMPPLMLLVLGGFLYWVIQGFARA